MKDYPHDEFFKYLFSLLDVAKAFMEAFLPQDVLAWLDLDTLAPDDIGHITPELAAVFSDKVFTCKLKGTIGKNKKPLTAVIAILLEHKSFLPRHPHFQLNEYRQRIWSEKTSKKLRPTVVLPVILYHGEKKWRIKPMSDYFGKIPNELKPYIGDFKYILVDLPAQSDEQLLRLKLGFLAYGLLTMKHAHDKKWLHSQLRVIFEKGEEYLKTEEGQNFVEHLFVYYAKCSEISGPELKKQVEHNFTDAMQTRTLSTYEQLILEGELKGIAKGKAEGIAEGIAEGLAKGETKGKSEQACLFAKKLLRNFPQWTDEQIAELSEVKVGDVKKFRAELKKSMAKTPEK